MSLIGKWGYSFNEGHYSGLFDSRDEAIAEGSKNLSPGSTIWVGQFRSPLCEQYLEGDDLIEKILCQDEYSGDWGDDAIHPTEEQSGELTLLLRSMFGRWLDRNGLRPTFGIADDPEEIRIP